MRKGYVAMATVPITIEVDAEVARIYTEASPQDRLRIQMLINLRLQEFIAHPPRPLGEVIEEISARVSERGLTKETLESILRDEE
ncbi:MAG: hypothetical protein F4X65_10285 [Chloroflexi bacterium]|nr:hypothetical protein [Chloroflexota bacterium]